MISFIEEPHKRLLTELDIVVQHGVVRKAGIETKLDVLPEFHDQHVAEVEVHVVLIQPIAKDPGIVDPLQACANGFVYRGDQPETIAHVVVHFTSLHQRGILERIGSESLENQLL